MMREGRPKTQSWRKLRPAREQNPTPSRRQTTLKVKHEKKNGGVEALWWPGTCLFNSALNEFLNKTVYILQAKVMYAFPFIFVDLSRLHFQKFLFEELNGYLIHIQRCSYRGSCSCVCSFMFPSKRWLLQQGIKLFRRIIYSVYMNVLFA